MLPKEVLHMKGVPGPQQGPVKNGMGYVGIVRVSLRELKPPWLNPVIPARVDKGHITRGLGYDQDTAAERTERP